jgi:hypothetical protein
MTVVPCVRENEGICVCLENHKDGVVESRLLGQLIVRSARENELDRCVHVWSILVMSFTTTGTFGQPYGPL